MKFILGIEDKSNISSVLDTFIDLGEKYVDTSPLYGYGECFIGSYQKRKKLKVFTKIGLSKKYPGLSKKSVFSSIEESLKKLRVEKIDTVFVHVWDFTKDINQTKDCLLELKEKYNCKLGVSNTPSWIISSLEIFSSIQLELNLCNATSKIELLPMANFNKMKTYSYSPFFNGLIFQTKKIFNKDYKKQINKIKKEVGIDLAKISLQYVMHHNLTPIIRTTNKSNLITNYNSLCCEVDERIICKLENIIKLPKISPYNVLESKVVQSLIGENK